jgi:hypothetical protein
VFAPIARLESIRLIISLAAQHKFKMDGCMPVSILIECGLKLSKCDRAEMVDATDFKSLVGSLQYLTCTRPNILYATGLIS